MSEGKKGAARWQLDGALTTARGCVGMVVLLVATACGTPSGPSIDSATHWLQRCTEDAECGDEGSCLCGICSAPCGTFDDCTRGGVCAPTGEAPLAAACAQGPGPRGAVGICVEPCGGQSCTGESLTCVDTYCLPSGVAQPLDDEPADASRLDAAVDASADADAASDPDAGPDGAADASGNSAPDVQTLDAAEAGMDAGDAQSPDATVRGTQPSQQRVLHAALGESHTCVQAQDGYVYCWGGNAQGQLGLGDTDNRGDDPAEVGAGLQGFDLGMDTLVQLRAGGGHTCALDVQGRVKCWGANAAGQLGLGDTDNRGDEAGEMAALPFVALGEGVLAVELALGNAHTCARTSPGNRVVCWGDNSVGQLGLGNTTRVGDEPPSEAFVEVNLGTGRSAVAISAMAFSTCAVLDDDTLRCWGQNNLGQLGLGDLDPRGDGPGEMGDNLPAVDTGASGHFRISAGGQHLCVVYADFSLRCFGYNASGQLGLGDSESRGDSPEDMGVELPALSLPAGVNAVTPVCGRSHTCVGFDDQELRCWGSGARGQLGLGTSDDYGGQPGETPSALAGVPTRSGRQLAEAYTGGGHVCLRYMDGSLQCFGDNAQGQLGLGDTEHRGDDPDELGDALPFVFDP